MVINPPVGNSLKQVVVKVDRPANKKEIVFCLIAAGLENRWQPYLRVSVVFK